MHYKGTFMMIGQINECPSARAENRDLFSYDPLSEDVQ